MAVENLNTIRGVLFAKDVRKVPNKKAPTEPDYEFYSIKLEYRIDFGGKERTCMAEMQLDRGVNYDGFSVSDSISVDYYLFGKKISDTWFKTEAKVVHIAFNSINSSYDNHKGKIKVDARSDINELLPPSPNDDDNEQLPF